MNRTMMLALMALLVGGCSCCEKRTIDEKAREGRLSVFDFGAVGDGVTDDTAAIQRGLDYLAERGGGKLYFPYTPKGYLIASPGREFDKNGKIVRAQLVIPSGKHVIQLEGEFPPKILYEYQVRPDDGDPHFVPTKFGNMGHMSVILHSTWDAPEVHDPKERPWAVIAAPEGTSCEGLFSVPLVSIKNLEVRVHLDHDRMYPTTSAVNLQNSSRIIIQDAQFCLDDMVGDLPSKKELLENPCHTVGFMGSGAQSDDQIIRNIAVQGFKYGIVLSEHTTAEHIYVHNCEYGVAIASAGHPIIINRVLSQHNQRIFAALPEGSFGRRARKIYLRVNQCAFERGEEVSVPKVSNTKYAVWDPENRIYGSVEYMQGWPGRIDKCFFPMRGGMNFKASAIGEKDPENTPRRGILCLTFDDDHIDNWVSSIDLFAKYGARASFFLSGAIDGKDIEGIKKLRKAGHAVGVHTLNHKAFTIRNATEDQCRAYYESEVKPQVDALARAGIPVKCMAMPQNAHSRQIDNYLLFNCGLKRLRIGGDNFDRQRWRNSTAFDKMRVMRGEGVGEYYKTDIDALLKRLQDASDSNTIFTLFSHDIAPDAKAVHMKKEWLERILAKAVSLGMEFRTLDD